MHQLNSTKRARLTSNAIHLPGSRILHYFRFRYPICDGIGGQIENRVKNGFVTVKDLLLVRGVRGIRKLP
jgi:hypothetical protein